MRHPASPVPGSHEIGCELDTTLRNPSLIAGRERANHALYLTAPRYALKII